MIAGHLREKDGYYYCVLSYTDHTGKRKQMWKATGLPVKGNKKRAEEMLSPFRKSFVVPKAPADYFDFSEEMLFTDFMRAWLEVVRTTFGGYQTTVEKKFIPYFEPKGLALANVQARDLQSFYLHEMKTLSGTTVRHEHALLHKILKYAYRMDLISHNPADKVDPPRAERFEGSAYTEEGSIINVGVSQKKMSKKVENLLEYSYHPKTDRRSTLCSLQIIHQSYWICKMFR